MPYAALQLEVELAIERAEAEQQQEWHLAAFVGWQTASSMGGKVGPFKKYAKNLGLALPEETLTEDDVQRERATAERNAEMVRRAFDGG